ncbi:unnamed protein product, partial [Prorocentrum cordatum]
RVADATVPDYAGKPPSGKPGEQDWSTSWTGSTMRCDDRLCCSIPRAFCGSGLLVWSFTLNSRSGCDHVLFVATFVQLLTCYTLDLAENDRPQRSLYCRGSPYTGMVAHDMGPVAPEEPPSTSPPDILEAEPAPDMGPVAPEETPPRGRKIRS